MEIKLVDVWEERAKTFKDKKESVMQQSFPSVLNDYVHRVHAQEVLANLPKEGCICLDIGCGYGRLAIEVIGRNKKAFVYGIDISRTFVDFFNKKLGDKGEGIAGDVRKLPFKNNTFDYVYCVVSLMYLKIEKDQKMGVSEMLRVLKPGGKAVLIEPNATGDNLVKLFGILPFILRKILKKKKVETYGISFGWNIIDKLIMGSGGKLIEKKGYPFFTILFLPLFVASKISPYLAHFILNGVEKIDKKISVARISNVVTYVVEKPKNRREKD